MTAGTAAAGGGTVPVLVGLFVAGLAGSLHCLAMCGPIQLAFGRWRAQKLGDRGVLGSIADAAGYHAGRLWTYALLGLVAGAVGGAVGRGASWLGWQRPLAIALGAGLMLAGVLMVGGLRGRLPSAWFSLPGGCLAALNRFPALATLASGRQTLLLGAVLGLLPCGLVYGALVVAATLPTPWHAALAMLSFGVGTLPALSALALSSGAVPQWAAGRSPQISGGLLVIAGVVVVVRALHAG